ncbi:hypothetical protein RIF29_16894 [Crotalaria pallida]|uniref:Uncharacterized protein n=1 Tax=Crotalaria pallida TaxID=3830 RepID=A0AAN9FG53_CROPI
MTSSLSIAISPFTNKKKSPPSSLKPPSSSRPRVRGVTSWVAFSTIKMYVHNSRHNLRDTLFVFMSVFRITRHFGLLCVSFLFYSCTS